MSIRKWGITSMGIPLYVIDDYSKDFVVTEAVINNKFIHLNAEFDKLMIDHAINISKIDTRIILESGTDEDLTYLYEKEVENTKEKGKGIITSLVDLVKKLFKKIKEIIFGVEKDVKEVPPEKLPKEVEIPENPHTLLKQGNDIVSRFKSFFSGKKGVLKAIGVVGGTTALYKLTKHEIVPFVKNLYQLSDDINETIENGEKRINDGSLEDQEELKNGLGKIRAFGNRV